MIDLGSEELHAGVVAPALRLLAGRHGLDKVEVAYQDAIKEISNGNPDDAITDAGTAARDAHRDRLHRQCVGSAHQGRQEAGATRAPRRQT